MRSAARFSVMLAPLLLSAERLSLRTYMTAGIMRISLKNYYGTIEEAKADIADCSCCST